MDYLKLFFWSVIFFIAIGIIGARTFQEGMFMDGLLYAMVAHNMANGLGEFWFPMYDKVSHFFNQQPPLFFNLLSLFYKLFGDSVYIEKTFSFFNLILSVILIILIWRKINKQNKELKNMEWLPVLLFITTPIVPWSFSNNMIENLMLNTCLVSVYAFLYFKENMFLSLLIGSSFIIISSLLKGIQGMFPILFFIYYSLAFYQFKIKSQYLILNFIVVGIVVLFYIILFSYPKPYASLTDYFHGRVLNSIQNVSNVESRFYLWFRLFFIELLPAETLILLLFFINKYKFKSGISIKHKEYILLFFLIGLSGSLPLIITKEQRGFYLMTALPFFIISFAMIAGQYIMPYIQNIQLNSKNAYIFSLVFILSALFVFIKNFGKIGRDEVELHDVHLIGKKIPEWTIVFTDNAFYEKYNFREYLLRYYFISMDRYNQEKYDYAIFNDTVQKKLNYKYEKIPIPTQQYHLWRKINPQFSTDH